MSFKVGDKIMCTRASQDGKLVRGSVYTVNRAYGQGANSYVSLLNTKWDYYANRFVPACSLAKVMAGNSVEVET